MSYTDICFCLKLKTETIPYSLLLLADESLKAINSYIHQCVIYLLKDDLNTIGVCAIQLVDDSSLEIKNLAISEEYRNNGLGTFCLQQLAAIYPQQSFLVATGDGSLKAQRFYRNNGFSLDAVKKDFFLLHYEHPIIENGIQLKDQLIFKREFQVATKAILPKFIQSKI